MSSTTAFTYNLEAHQKISKHIKRFSSTSKDIQAYYKIFKHIKRSSQAQHCFQGAFCRLVGGAGLCGAADHQDPISGSLCSIQDVNGIHDILTVE